MIKIGDKVMLSKESEFYGDEEDYTNPMGCVGVVVHVRGNISWNLPVIVDWGIEVDGQRVENSYAQNDLVVV